jgi:hypothetical protein
MRIWKYELEVTDFPQLFLPIGSEILSVGNQNGLLCVWVKCNPQEPKEAFHFAIVGTGNPMPDNLGCFLGTVQMPPFVWHVFQVPK